MLSALFSGDGKQGNKEEMIVQKFCCIVFDHRI